MAINLTEGGGVVIKPEHKASCHCRAVALMPELPDGVIDMRRCDCSIAHCRSLFIAGIEQAIVIQKAQTGFPSRTS